jgi:hypothetical protein
MNLRAPRHSTVVAYLALGVALSGSAYAANQLTGRDVRDASLTGRDIANSTLTGMDVRRGSIGGVDIRDGSVTRRDLRPGILVAGPPGPIGLPGPAGPAGAKGADGAARAYAGVAANGAVVEGSRNVRSAKRIGSGRYCVRLVSVIDAARAVPAVTANAFGGPTDVAGTRDDDLLVVEASSVNQDCRNAGQPNSVYVRTLEHKFENGAFVGNYLVDSAFFIVVP